MGCGLGTHYTVMRHCQDGQLFAVPQFNRSSPVSPSHNNTADTAADATPYGLNGDAKIEPCNQCLSSWQIRGSSHHGNDVVGGENGHASCDYSSSTPCEGASETAVGGEGGVAYSAGVAWGRDGTGSEDTESDDKAPPHSGKRDSKWMWFFYHSMTEFYGHISVS